VASDFVKALTNTFTIFSFASVNSLICGSRKLELFSQLRCYVNIWPYQK